MTQGGVPDKQAVYRDEQAAFSPAYESGDEYNGQGTGDDGDYEDGNNMVAVGQASQKQ